MQTIPDTDPQTEPAAIEAIGIVGGGQLAWMLAQAARDLGVALHVQTPGADDPASREAASVVLAAVDDVAATRELASRCSAISFENEWIPLEALQPLEGPALQFLPGLEALRPLVSKAGQRRLLGDLHLPAPRWFPLADVFQPAAPGPAHGGQATVPVSQPRPTLSPAAPRLPEGFDFPMMAKASRGGYDGRGTVPLADLAALEELLARVDADDWILEELVRFEQELALVACRDRHGTVACYPLVQTHQHRRVCDWVLFPAPVDHRVEVFARNVAVSLLTALDYVGVLSIEFFYGPSGLQVNELAPRTHNSGHLTIEACRTSQFSQQVRIVAGLPMGATDAVVPGALMVNLLAPEGGDADQLERRQALEALPGAHLHWYGKQGGGAGRKLGHLTLLLEGRTDAERELDKQRRLAQVRAIWPLPGSAT
ncbi:MULTISPECIES: 5-(carboxyamino)imidazole ribonucleotide synthase [unclassified Cyanobium]|uniref:5-(carboxyamino)imidazole ribonucleotide synthase n=1 Tax=unclassified Cyanobium TaxID=2627006 RepID=UPI0028F4481F|nr:MULTISPECIES: 5-(carboxyamino)imidazole ribonucleotide synthase [unclassified Cyanobium]